jgi:hypothetical protein
MALLKRNELVIIDPLQEAVDQSAQAINIFYTVQGELADANAALDAVIQDEQAIIEAASARASAARRQTEANNAIVTNIDNILGSN